jgi:hypothetical protein
MKFQGESDMAKKGRTFLNDINEVPPTLAFLLLSFESC